MMNYYSKDDWLLTWTVTSWRNPLAPARLHWQSEVLASWVTELFMITATAWVWLRVGAAGLWRPARARGSLARAAGQTVSWPRQLESDSALDSGSAEAGPGPIMVPVTDSFDTSSSSQFGCRLRVQLQVENSQSVFSSSTWLGSYSSIDSELEWRSATLKLWSENKTIIRLGPEIILVKDNRYH